MKKVPTISVACVTCSSSFLACRSDAQYCSECTVKRKREQWHKWRAKPGSAEKVRDYSRAHEAKTQYRKEWRIKKLYAITLTEYETLMDSVDRACQICSSKSDPCLDHDHVTGKVRGVLCRSCNKAIGQLGDSADSIRKALDYLEHANAHPYN